MLNIKMHTLEEEECGVCGGWKQLRTGRTLTQHTPKLPGPLHSGEIPCNQVPLVRVKRYSRKHLPNSGMGEGIWQIILMLLVCQKTKTRNWISPLLSPHHTHKYAK